MWEIGVLLAGIGFLILCIFGAVTLRDFAYTAKKINQILEDNEKSIKEITGSVAEITDSVDNVFATSEKVIKALTTFGAIRSIKKQ